MVETKPETRASFNDQLDIILSLVGIVCFGIIIWSAFS